MEGGDTANRVAILEREPYHIVVGGIVFIRFLSFCLNKQMINSLHISSPHIVSCIYVYVCLT